MSEIDELRAEVAALRAEIEVMDGDLRKTMIMNKHLYETLHALASFAVTMPRMLRPTSEEDYQEIRSRTPDLLKEIQEGLRASYNSYWPDDAQE